MVEDWDIHDYYIDEVLNPSPKNNNVLNNQSNDITTDPSASNSSIIGKELTRNKFINRKC